MLKYAGIGSVLAPTGACELITMVAQAMDSRGWKLRTYNDLGAANAFALGAKNKNTDIIHLDGFTASPKLLEVAGDFYHQFPKLSDWVRNQLGRNAAVIMGRMADDPVDVVIYWQHVESKDAYFGLCNHMRRIAHAHGIKSFNVASDEDQVALDEYINEKESEAEA